MSLAPDLHTSRLRLRAPSATDWPVYERFYTDGQASARYGGPLSPRAAWARLASDIGQWALTGFGVWVIERLDDGAGVGTCGFWQAPGWPRELTWWLLPEARGQGLAQEASQAVLAQAHDGWGWAAVHTYMPDDNAEARALVQRLGGRRIDRRVFPDGQQRDVFELPPPGEPSFLYFGYGSNMCSPRLLDRTPSARSLGHAVLHDHGLRWHMRGRDGSGKCDVVAQPGEQVHGVLWRIAERDRPALDEAEGLGHAYKSVQRPVRAMRAGWGGQGQQDQAHALAHADDGHAPLATLYLALLTEPQARPFAWYRALVISGAREHALPEDWLVQLQTQVADHDTDAERHARHMAIVRRSPGADPQDR